MKRWLSARVIDRAHAKTGFLLARHPSCPARCISSTRPAPESLKNRSEIDRYLSQPTWSVKSLLPTEEQTQGISEITSGKLHHLLRLSALPPPANSQEEEKMLKDLRAQLHFVRAVQSVDTGCVRPMSGVRDETQEAAEPRTLSFESMEDILNKEEVVGRYHKRIRRREVVQSESVSAEDWDVLGQAPKKMGRYFVVESDKQ